MLELFTDTFWLDHAWPLFKNQSRQHSHAKGMGTNWCVHGKPQWQGRSVFLFFSICAEVMMKGCSFGKIAVCSKRVKMFIPTLSDFNPTVRCRISFQLRSFGSFSTLQRHQMHKVMYMKEPAPEAPHLRTFRVRSCPVAWKTTNNWLWIAWMFVAYRWPMDRSLRWKKQVPLKIDKPKQSFMLNFDSELFPQTRLLWYVFSIVSIHLRRDQGELRGTSVVTHVFGRSQAKKPRWSDAGLGTTLCEKHHNQANLRSYKGNPSFRSEKKWAKRLDIIKPEGFDWLNVVLFWLPILKNLDEFGITWGYLGTPSHQMPLLKFFTSIWCGKWQEWAANPNTLETTQKHLAWLRFRSTHESCKYAHEVFYRSSLNCIHLGCQKRRPYWAVFSWAVFKTLVATVATFQLYTGFFIWTLRMACCNP